MAKLDNEMRIVLSGENKTSKMFDEVKKASSDATNTIQARFQSLDKSLRSITSNISKSLLTAFAANEFRKFTKNAAKLGADSIESANLFAVSFGRMSRDMDKFGKDLQDLSGMSEITFRNQSAQLNDLFIASGQSAEEAMNKVQGLMERGLDLSSLRNVDRKLMFEQLTSGLVGIIEPLRKYGIYLDVENVENYAFAKGIAEVGTELTQQQKLLARYGMIMEGSAKAQGDLARTINTVGNASKRLSDLWMQFLTLTGRLFVPVMALVLRVLIPIVEALNLFIGTIHEVVRALGELYKSSALFRVLATVVGIAGVAYVLYATRALIASAATAILNGFIKLSVLVFKLLTGSITLANIAINMMYVKIFLLVGAIYLLLRALGFFKNKNKETANSAEEVKNQYTGVADGIKKIGKEQKKLTPLDEILNIGDDKSGAGGIEDGYGMNPGEMLSSEEIQSLTNELLKADGALAAMGISTEKLGNAIKIAGAAIAVFMGASVIGTLIKGIGLAMGAGATVGLLPFLGVLTAIAGIGIITVGAIAIVQGLAEIKELNKEMDALIANNNKNSQDYINVVNSKANPAQKEQIVNRLQTQLKGYVDQMKKYEKYNWMQKIASAGAIKANKNLVDTTRNEIRSFGGVPKYANGGNPPKNKPSLVGERGPELFIPNQRGLVVSNDDIKGMVSGGGNDNGALISALQSMNSQQPVVLNIDGREFARATYGSYQSEGNRNGQNLRVRSVV